MNREAKSELRDTIVTTLAEAVRAGALTQIDAMAICAEACAAIIATMLLPQHHAEALDVIIEKLPKQVAAHAAEVAAYRKARSN